MKVDIGLKELMQHEDVFAEIFNVLVYQGQQIIQGEALTSVPTEAVTLDIKGDLHERRRDIVKADARGNYYHLMFDVENQTTVDNTMPQRVMGYDYSLYEHQIKQIMDRNKSNRENAFVKRIHDDQKLAPVLSVVLYWGEEEWTGPSCLHDMLDFPEEIRESLKPLVPDYSMNLVCMAKLPEAVRKKMHTDLRFLAEYAAHYKEPEKWLDFVEQDSQKINHLEDCLTALSALSGDRKFREIYKPVSKKLKKNVKEDVAMCKVIDILEERGEQRGKQIGIQLGIQKAIPLLIKNYKMLHQPIEVVISEIMSELSIPHQEAEEYVKQYW